MSEVLKALEYMVQHGGKWETVRVAGNWILTLSPEHEADKKDCGKAMFVTAIEINEFVAEYKQLKRERQAYQELRKEDNNG